ncbi:hypothetical protein GDO78_014104 [Eleutherodactylus coqui]|uniref:Uncharacterized protein n=1 Tax=Eleutherodactylus coqui TaxID=57060 RepID=A0A8J6JL80_ELECQ|nr:hypothetical protein GDO78_014104 [Eleutherodactylus coqui]
METLQHPKYRAGMALPDFKLYYVARQVRYIRHWLSGSLLPNSEHHQMVFLSKISLWVVLERPELLDRQTLPIHKLAVRVWQACKALTKYLDTPLETPLWYNRVLPTPCEFTRKAVLGALGNHHIITPIYQ